jgi:hypothetical protein
MSAAPRPEWLTDDQVDALAAEERRLGRRLGVPWIMKTIGVGCHRGRTAQAWLLENTIEPAPPTPAADTASPAERWDHSVGENRQAIHSVSSTIRTLEDALEAAKVDPVVWEVERYVVNKWDQGSKNKAGDVQVVELWQVKVWLRRRVPAVLEDATAELVKRLEPLRRARQNSPPPPAEDPHLLELSIVDHHFGKLAWHGETGNDYDLEIAERLYVDAVEDILAKTAGYQVDRILFPVGHDLFNYDNPRGETAGGTPQDNDSRPAKVYATALRAVAGAVELAAEVAPVEVRWVRGNHDPTVSYWLALALGQRFLYDHQVEVVTDPRARQYVRYGVNLLGLTHGDLTKAGLDSLPTVMAAEVPDLWAATLCREWHLGHFHKRKELRTLPLDTFNGVAVRILPSLCGTDAWHYDKGYVGNAKATDAYLWSRDRGFTGHFVSYANPEAFDAPSTS